MVVVVVDARSADDGVTAFGVAEVVTEIDQIDLTAHGSCGPHDVVVDEALRALVAAGLRSSRIDGKALRITAVCGRWDVSQDRDPAEPSPLIPRPCEAVGARVSRREDVLLCVCGGDDVVGRKSL